MNGDSAFLTNRDVILEIRSDVKRLTAKIDEINERGSIGTKAELDDHERRIRAVERFKYALPVGFMTSTAAICIAILTH